MRYSIEYNSSGTANVTVDEAAMVCVQTHNDTVYDDHHLLPASQVRTMVEAGDTVMVWDEHFWGRTPNEHSGVTVQITAIVDMGTPIPVAD